MVGIEKIIEKIKLTINNGWTHAVSLIQFQIPPKTFEKNRIIGFMLHSRSS
jgi:hypothetical protein